jgi:hypothetical protein
MPRRKLATAFYFSSTNLSQSFLYLSNQIFPRILPVQLFNGHQIDFLIHCFGPAPQEPRSVIFGVQKDAPVTNDQPLLAGAAVVYIDNHVIPLPLFAQQAF